MKQKKLMISWKLIVYDFLEIINYIRLKRSKKNPIKS